MKIYITNTTMANKSKIWDRHLVVGMSTLSYAPSTSVQYMYSQQRKEETQHWCIRSPSWELMAMSEEDFSQLPWIGRRPVSNCKKFYNLHWSGQKAVPKLNFCFLKSQISQSEESSMYPRNMKQNRCILQKVHMPQIEPAKVQYHQ